MDLYLRFHRSGRSTFMGHLDWIREVQSILLRTGLKLKYRGEYNPKMKLAFSPPLPMGTESEAEYVYISLLRYTPLKEVHREIACVLPGGVQLVEVGQGKKDRHTTETVEFEFTFLGADAERIEDEIEDLWEGDPEGVESEAFNEVSEQLRRATGMDLLDVENGIALKVYSPHEERNIFRAGKFTTGIIELLGLIGYPLVRKRVVTPENLT
jgi:radical SAM-linked protein